MRKFLTLLAVLLLSCTVLFSQNRAITGKISDNKGEPVPFASIKIKGGKKGASADANGMFSIDAKIGDVLIVSGAGFKNQEITISSSVVNLTLERNTAELSEVVVSGAYGAKRASRGGTSNVQVVTAEKLNTIRNTNINEALAGKVAGIQLRGQSGSKLTSGGQVILHGADGLLGSSGLLYVLDGNRVSADDINPDDIEDVSLLLGPSAAAVFGPDAKAGALVITSKKGRKGAGLGIDVNLGVTFSNVYVLPNYQNAYAGGDWSELKKYTWQPGQPLEWKALDGKYYPDYSEDVSWGPRMVGQEYIPWYAWYGGHDRSYKTALLTPQPNNARDFFQTQVKGYNSISFSKATDVSSTRFSYTNVDVRGTLPTTWLKRNQFAGNASFDLSSRFTGNFELTYITQKSRGDFNDNYANQSSGSFNQWFHRDLDMSIVRELKDLRTPSGIQASWNHAGPDAYKASNGGLDVYRPYYWANFYTSFDQVIQLNNFNKLIGSASITFKVNKDLNIRGTYRMKNTNSFFEYKVSSDVAQYQFASQAAGGYIKGGYSTNTFTDNDEHIELVGTYAKTIKDFAVNATAGMDLRSYKSHINGGSTSDGFNTPDVFSLNNSKGTPTTFSFLSKLKNNAIFATPGVNYKKMIYLEAALRQDWYSTLPADNNGIFSKSFGGSFVFSELLKNQASWLSFGKIRASFGEVPSAIDPYVYPGAQYFQAAIPFNGNFMQFASNTLSDSALQGSVAKENVFGIDLRFLKSRVGLSVTYTSKKNSNFTTTIRRSFTSLYPNYVTNAGEIEYKGMDYVLNLKPVWNRKVKWEFNATFQKIISNDVIDVDGKPQSDWRDNNLAAPSVTVQTAAFGPAVRAVEGKTWGQIVGNGIKRDANGNALLNSNGTYVYERTTFFGSVLPEFTGGVQNSVTLFDNFTVNFNIDFQKGGKFYSTTTKWGNGTGVLAATAAINDKGKSVRDNVADGGGVHVFGVDATTLKPVDYYVNVRDYYNGSNNTFDNDIFELTYVKLREVAIGYNIPVNKLKLSNWVKRANISLVANNALLIYAKTKDFDPSEISNISGEGGQLPGLRSFGFNLKVGF